MSNCRLKIGDKDILKWGEDNFNLLFLVFEGLLKTPEDN